MPIQGISYPSGALTTGVQQTDLLMSDYVFQAGIADVNHSNLLAYKYGNLYYMTALLEMLGRYKPQSGDVHSWSTMDRTRKSGAVTAYSAGTATLDIAAPGYFIPGDVVRNAENGILFIVDAIANDSGFQTVDVSRLDGVAIGAGQIAAGHQLGHATTAFPEASFGPLGRVWLPENDYNFFQILRRSLSISGTALTQKTILENGKSWYWTNEEITRKELALDREIAVMFGQRTRVGNRDTMGGIWDFVLNQGGQEERFAGAVTEDSLQAMISRLKNQGGSSEYTVLAGSDYIGDFMRALRPYALEAIDYGTFGNERIAGLDFEKYRFNGTTITVKHYQLFDDDAVLPFAEGDTTSPEKFNFSNTALWLDMGSDDVGQPLIQLIYKQLDGIQRKLVQKYIPGMVSPYGDHGGVASNSQDAFTIEMLSDISLEMKFANRHGIHAQDATA